MCVYLLPECYVAPADQSYGKTTLMKALLHLRDGKNETVELLIEISESLGDIKEFVNAAYTSSYYKGTLFICESKSLNFTQSFLRDPTLSVFPSKHNDVWLWQVRQLSI